MCMYICATHKKGSDWTAARFSFYVSSATSVSMSNCALALINTWWDYWNSCGASPFTSKAFDSLCSA